MSNRNTPKSNKPNRVPGHLNRLLDKRKDTPNGKKNVNTVTSTPGLRHRITSKTPIRDVECYSREAMSEHARIMHNKEVLNTGFTKIPGTPTALTPRLKSKPTELNACYTPSSLYRAANCTPNTKSGHLGNSSAAKLTKFAKSTIDGCTSDVGEDNNTEISNLTVVVRVRPLNEQECTRAAVNNIVRIRRNELTVIAGLNVDCSAGVQHSFSYDHVFTSCDPESEQFASQEAVFNGTALPLIDRAFEGYNTCLFAYGQTGSGKSYSMMGIESLDDAALDGKAPHAEAGIIPRFCHQLFRRIEMLKDQVQAEIEVSYFEIYNEKIHDLLCVAQAETTTVGGNAFNCGSTPSQRQALKVREHPIWGPYVVDLSVHPVDSYEALRNWLAVGNSQRATAATGMNEKSSRSHSIFNILLNLTELIQTETGSDTEQQSTRQTRRSKISLVDLAGSERVSTSGFNGERIREGVSINKSLLTLGKVIAALSEVRKHNSTNAFVPYRESVLTWLLRENLGGNSKTVMLATISPASVHIDETLATLRYACQARTIVNRVKVNESPHDKIIRELRAEVDRLKSLRNEYERQRRVSGNSNPTPRKIIIETSVNDSEVEALRLQLAERERELKCAQKSWMERLREAEDQRKTELRLLKRRGLALELSAEQKQACLVNLAADPILSGTLFYILPPGKVKVGRTRTSTYCSQPDILLDGPLVGYHHCIIENEQGHLFVTPENPDFETYLNGEMVQKRQQMFHGDRLVIGGSHYFRILNPLCSKRAKTTLVDFELAHQEILHKQEEKLRRELEDEKTAALSRIELQRAENERNFQDRLLELEMEQLKYKCNREILETERKMLEEEDAIKRNTPHDTTMRTPSFKSTLLEDISRIMQQPSEESLHKTQLMVKEATQRCRNLGLKLEFHQSQVLDEFGMFRTVVLILDQQNKLKAEWPTARLGVWLDMMRDAENVKIDSIFNAVDIEWMPLDDDEKNETLNESLNSSKISLNLSIVKETMLKQPLQIVTQMFNKGKGSHRSVGGEQRTPKSATPMTKSALLNSAHLNTKKMLTYDDVTPSALVTSPVRPPLSPHTSNIDGNSKDKEQSFAVKAVILIREMQRTAIRLKKLCAHVETEQENNQLASEQVVHEAIERVESILQGVHLCLDQDVQANSMNVSPTKTPKSVRFLID